MALMPSVSGGTLHLLKAVLVLVACQAVENSTQDDETALLQHGVSVKHRHHKAGPHERTPRAPSGSLVSKLELGARFDCEEHPNLCKPPFDCHKVDESSIQLWLQEGAAFEGTPNYQLWCAVPHYEAYAARCAKGELDSASKVQFQLTAAGHFGAHTKDMDGSYCFIEGHCVNEQVTNKTTVDDAVDLCDDRFGREAWSTWGSETTPREYHLDFDVPSDLSAGWQSSTQTRPSILAACAMGNYHCDVMYCKNTYCKEEYYRKRYGHLLKENGWTQ